MQRIIEVRTPTSSFLVVWGPGISCQELSPEGVRTVGYLNDVSEDARSIVERAVGQLMPQQATYPAILNKNPWEDLRFKTASLNSCIDCPELNS